jgi:hypothetical protein
MMTLAQSQFLPSAGGTAAETALACMNCLAALVAITLLGAIPACAQRKLLSNQGTPRRLLAWLLPACLLAGVLAALTVPADLGYFLVRHGVIADDARITLAVTFAAGLCVAAAAMFASVGWWDAARTVGTRRAPKRLARLLPAAGAYFVLGVAVAVLWHRWRLAPAEWSGPGAWALIGVMVPVGLNAGGIARSLANRGLDRVASLAVGLFPTAALLLLTWILFGRPLRADSLSNPVRAMGIDSAPLHGMTLGGFALGYLLVVAALGVGGWIGIRLAPKPRLRDTGSRLDPRMREAEFASVGVRHGAARQAAAASPTLRLVGRNAGGTVTAGPEDEPAPR